MTRTTYVCILIGIAMTAAPLVGSALTVPATEELPAVELVYDEAGRLLYEVGIEPTNPTLAYTKHYLHVGDTSFNAKPGGGGGSNDCTATGYRVAGWFWAEPYGAYSTNYASIVSGALNEWDGHTSASISNGASSGNRGTAGAQDFVNQLDWVNLGASSTIAVTTTWYYRGSGQAVESDGQYNTYYSWSTSGDANAMDVENIVQHEVGHTLGLNHPGSGSCLTMYAYAANGETQKRTLGAGDILGIQAVYGK